MANDRVKDLLMAFGSSSWKNGINIFLRRGGLWVKQDERHPEYDLRYTKSEVSVGAE